MRAIHMAVPVDPSGDNIEHDFNPLDNAAFRLRGRAWLTPLKKSKTSSFRTGVAAPSSVAFFWLTIGGRGPALFALGQTGSGSTECRMLASSTLPCTILLWLNIVMAALGQKQTTRDYFCIAI
jgi:hypothetical protein